MVEDPNSCGHPLHVAGTDDAALSGRVAMDDLAVIDDRHGLKAAMWVGPNAAWPAHRLELVRTCVVEQQKRAEFVSKLIIREDPTNGEPIPEPVLFSVAEHIDERLQDQTPFHDPRSVAGVRRVSPDRSLLPMRF